ncbi:MAG TPA: ABC transporter ATP-binding protein [Flavisolibacter sp.]|jgi:ABC-type multidrug transport system ATPase subunit|nr:ABC transporter ATP-binding protein [Flavisolibacter sp.]
MSEVIRIEHLSKKFSEVKAVDNLSFSVQKGEVYGFLGQNGAGKSTTIRMLLTLVKPSGGTISIFGKSIQTHRKEILQNIGAIIEKPDLYKYLTALQNIHIISKLSGVHPDSKQLMLQLEKVGIAERANSKVKTFSQGMKQRLGIACALIHNPELIILDEPTNGLDPHGIADVRNLILRLSKEEGKTVFVSSHLLSEIEVIADSMLIIDKGRKIAEGKVADLLNPANTLVEIETANDNKTKSILQQSQWNAFIQASENIVLKMHRREISSLTKFLIENNIEVFAIQPKHSLENYFLSLTTANQHVAAYKD